MGFIIVVGVVALCGLLLTGLKTVVIGFVLTVRIGERLKQSRLSQEMKSPDKCKHYDREEIDFYLVLTREMFKFTRCKDCGVWLERIER
jgi:hypothetical protein